MSALRLLATADRRRARDPRERSAFAKVRNAEHQFAIQLRKIARHVGEIIRSFEPGDPTVLPELQRTLEGYATIIEPWAMATSQRMLAEVLRRDEQAWAETAKTMSRALRQEIRQAPTGRMLQQLLREQVDLIKSLPIEAAQRVHKMTMELVSGGGRAAEIVPMILASGDVTISRANTIARTEVGRTATGLTQARAEYVGSEGYTWLTARDSDVRQSHRAMEGKFVYWNDPPTLDGLTGHAGALPNCRCTPIPVIPDTFV